VAGKKPNARAHSFGRVVNEAAAIGVVPMAHGAMPASAHWRRLSLAPDPAPQRQPDLNETHPPGPSVSSQPHRVVLRVELNVPSPGTPRNHARLALRKRHVRRKPIMPLSCGGEGVFLRMDGVLTVNCQTISLRQDLRCVTFGRDRAGSAWKGPDRRGPRPLSQFAEL
jgi:hypothetical protein